MINWVMEGITVEQVRRQYTKNAASLREMLDKARAIAPKKYRGYTVAQLEEMVWCYEHMAAGLPMPEQVIDRKSRPDGLPAARRTARGLPARLRQWLALTCCVGRIEASGLSHASLTRMKSASATCCMGVPR